MAKSKKAFEFGLQKIIILILVILVVIAAFVFIFKPGILEWIRNQPGFSQPMDNETEMTCDQLKTLSYYKIGKVVLERKTLDIVRHYYIVFQEEVEKTQSECPKNSWREVCIIDGCPDLSKKNKEECNAAEGREKKFEFHCIDDGGNYIYNKKEIETKLYWDYDIDNEGFGNLMLSSAGANEKLGVINNFFFEISGDAYNKYQSQLIEQEITLKMMEELNGAKYIMGGIYRSKGEIKPFTLNWKDLKGVKDINILAEKITKKNVFLYFSLSEQEVNILNLEPYISFNNKKTDANFLYLRNYTWSDGEIGSRLGFVSIVLNADVSRGNTEIGRIYPDGSIWLRKNSKLFKDYLTYSTEVKFNLNSNGRLFESNLIINYEIIRGLFQ